MNISQRIHRTHNDVVAYCISQISLCALRLLLKISVLKKTLGLCNKPLQNILILLVLFYLLFTPSSISANLLIIPNSEFRTLNSELQPPPLPSTHTSWGGHSSPDSLGTTPRDRRYVLEEMRVVASSPSESAGLISVVHLDDTPRATDLNLSEIMRDISGVNITVGGRGESNLRIRGFNRESVKIMVDGRQINAGYFGNVNLAEMPMFDISEIHIVKGAISPLYGVNSSGGVVNFVTRQPSDDTWLTLKASIKRNNTQNLQLITSHKFDMWDYWLNISGFRTDGFVLSNDFTPTQSENGGVREFSNNQNFDIQSKINFSLFDIHSLGFSAGYSFADERNVPSNIYETRYRQFKDLRRWHLSGLGSFQVTPFLSLQPNVYYDAYDNTYQEFNHPSLAPEFMGLDSILESWTFGVQNRLEYIISANNKLYHLLVYEKEAYNRKDNQGYPNWTSNSTELYNTSLLFNHNFNPAWQTSLSMGMSQSVRNYRPYSRLVLIEYILSAPTRPVSSEYILSDIEKDRTYSTEKRLSEQRTKIDTGLHLEPAFSLNFDDYRNTLNLAISRNVQYPYLRQLYSSSRGNPDLMPEKALKSEIGAGTRLSISNILLMPSMSLYYNILDDMIDRVNSPIYINQRRLQNAGVEMFLRVRFNNPPQIYGGGRGGLFIIETEHHIDYINLKMNKDYDFYEIPEWTFTNGLFVTIFKNLRFSYNINWSDTMYSPDDRGRLYTLPAKTLHNAGISYRSGNAGVSPAFIRNYTISFSLSNIFDIDYQEEWGYPAPGRNFSLSFELSY